MLDLLLIVISVIILINGIDLAFVIENSLAKVWIIIGITGIIFGLKD